MEIRRLAAEDGAAYWHLRLEALQREPLAFGKAAEEHQATSVEATAGRFGKSSAENFTLGAFAGERLIGMATFIRETGRKERHKGRIYAVYVSASYRGKGAGCALIAEILRKVKEDPTVEQVLISVAAGQKAALGLYRKFGFEIYGTEPRALKVDGEYVDEHLMVMKSPA